MNDLITAPAEQAPAPAPAASAPTYAPAEFLPEKFRVTTETGLDLEASARKLAESYGRLETRFRDGDLPPSAPTEYKIAVPEQFQEHWQEDGRITAFRDEALQAGLTQAQMDFVMGKYFQIAPDLVQGGIGASLEAVQADLTQAWGEGPAYDRELNNAHTVFLKFADPADRDRFDDMMSNPALAYRILAKIGPEVREGGGIPAAAESSRGESIQTLLMSDANRNPRHPEHAATRARIEAYYNSRYGTDPVR